VKIAAPKSGTPGTSAAIVRGKLRQANAPDTLVTSVPLFSDTGQFLGRVFAEGPETTFRLTVPPGTKRIVLDPNGSVLRRR